MHWNLNLIIFIIGFMFASMSSAMQAKMAETGVPVGVFDWPVDGVSGYALTRITDKEELLEKAANRKVQALISMKGSRGLFTDKKGCFNYGLWRARFDRESKERLSRFYKQGVIIGFYGPDEPHDWLCGPSYEDLEKICNHVNTEIPGLPCGYNVPPLWLKAKRDEHRALGLGKINFILRQGNFKNIRDWDVWARTVMNDAKWFDGKVYLSINGFTGKPKPAEIINAIKSLCRAKPDGVFVWKWDHISNMDLREAIEYCSKVQ